MADLVTAMKISAAGMHVQGERMRVASENAANADSTGSVPGAEPYRRKTITFKDTFDRELGAHVVKVDKVEETKGGKDVFGRKYAPSHPAADKDGYILTPNVNSIVEMMDMRQAQRTYEANLNAIEISKGMVQQTLGLLK